ncbi:MAG: hypothetical protein P8Z31_04975 [Gammaproteobacteria bacterium]
MHTSIRHPYSLLRLVILTTMLAGCIPYSDFPLTPPDSATDDSALIGDWYAEENGRRSIFRIGQGERAGAIVISIEEQDNGETGDVTRLRGHLSIIDGKTYLNILSDDPGEEIPGYMFARYAIDGGRLGIAINDPDYLLESVESGDLEGEIIEHEWSRSLHITASSEKLQRFVAEHDRQLFMETTYLERLRDRTHQPPGQ